MSDATAASSRPDPQPKERGGAPGFSSNLLRRVATALVALPAVLAAALAGPPWLAILTVAAAAGVGLAEYFALVAARGLRPMRASAGLLAAALFADAALPGSLGVPLAPIAALVLLAAALSWRGDIEAVTAAAFSLLGAVYLGALGGTIAGLRLVPTEADGGWRLVLLLGIVVLSDSFAFFVGHAVGRRRLAPSISPGKTVEGALGGLAGGVAGAFLVRAVGLPGLPALDTAILGLAVAALGIVGDLHESLLKRWAGVKDSGALFPGHGGMLDRLDSLLFGAPALYYYFGYLR